eukprot:1140429-Pelagomonas_calceolata.AAC.4
MEMAFEGMGNNGHTFSARRSLSINASYPCAGCCFKQASQASDLDKRTALCPPAHASAAPICYCSIVTVVNIVTLMGA